MKKWLALLLALVMACSVFVACGDSSDSDRASAENAEGTGDGLDLTGRWVSVFSMTEEMEGFGTVTFEFECNYEFTADGKVSVYVTSDEVEDVLSSLLRTLLDDKEALAQLSDVTVAEIDAVLAQEGLTWDEYVEIGVKEALPAAIKGFKQSTGYTADAQGRYVMLDGYYKREDDRIFLSEDSKFKASEGSPYTYVNGALTITESGSEIVLNKQ